MNSNEVGKSQIFLINNNIIQHCGVTNVIFIGGSKTELVVGKHSDRVEHKISSMSSVEPRKSKYAPVPNFLLWPKNICFKFAKCLYVMCILRADNSFCPSRIGFDIKHMMRRRGFRPTSKSDSTRRNGDRPGRPPCAQWQRQRQRSFKPYATVSTCRPATVRVRLAAADAGFPVCRVSLAIF